MCGNASKWLGPKKGGGPHRRVTEKERQWVEERKERWGWWHGAKVYPVKN